MELVKEIWWGVTMLIVMVFHYCIGQIATLDCIHMILASVCPCSVAFPPINFTLATFGTGVAYYFVCDISASTTPWLGGTWHTLAS